MKKHIITLLLLLVAIVFYAVGAAGPATGLLIVGALAELIFWLRVSGWLRSRSSERDNA